LGLLTVGTVKSSLAADLDTINADSPTERGKGSR